MSQLATHGGKSDLCIALRRASINDLAVRGIIAENPGQYSLLRTAKNMGFINKSDRSVFA
jgi:hypothetical protein